MEWRPVVGYEGIYEVSEFGDIISIKRMVNFGKHKRQSGGEIIKQRIGNPGYAQACLCFDGKEKTLLVHRVVAEAFGLGEGPIVRHLDGCKTNNHISNLLRGTYQENENDKEGHGTRVCGVKHHNSKLTEHSVMCAIKLNAFGLTQKQIADRFGISRSAMQMAIEGKTWGKSKNV